jgi:hypothetical protein
MQLKDASIRWGRSGQILVHRYEPQSHHRTARWRPVRSKYDELLEYTAGAVFAEVREMEGLEAQNYLLALFADFVIHYGIKPLLAHEALMRIDEYSEAMRHSAICQSERAEQGGAAS